MLQSSLFYSEFDAGRLVDELSVHGVKVVLYNIDHAVALTDILQRYYMSTQPADLPINFIVLCGLNCLRKLFSEVCTCTKNAVTS